MLILCFDEDEYVGVVVRNFQRQENCTNYKKCYKSSQIILFQYNSKALEGFAEFNVIIYE